MNRGIKITLISLTGGVGVAFLIFFLIERSQHKPFSPPDEPREWARKEFQDTFSPVPAVAGFPHLSGSPQPVLDVKHGVSEVKVEFAAPDSPDVIDRYEVFTPAAGKGIEVVLPTGNRFRLEAIALVMPGEISGKDEHGDVTPEWLDPETLEPLPPERAARWETEEYVKRDGPCLFVRISNTGSKTPVRWLGGNVFDERTLLRVQNSSSFSTHTIEAHYRFDLEIWHQTPLRLAIPFAFGKPEYQDLKLEAGAQVQFGDEGLARVVAVVPSRFRGSSSRRGGSIAGADRIYNLEFRFGGKSRSPVQGVLVQLWPPHTERMIDLIRIDKSGKQTFHNVWGTDGIADVNLPGAETLDRVRARWLPRLGRAVFLLPKLPKLPKVENLFDTPIPEAYLSYRDEFRETIARGAGVQWQAPTGPGLPSNLFPMTLKDMTPAKLLKKHQELTARPLYFHRRELTVSDQPVRGPLTRLKEWWKKNKPGWLP